MAIKRPATESYGGDWNIWRNDDGSISYDKIQIILLQEIRDQLKALNATLDCHNTRSIPGSLKGIRKDLKALTKSLATDKT